MSRRAHIAGKSRWRRVFSEVGSEVGSRGEAPTGLSALSVTPTATQAVYDYSSL